MKTAKCNRDCLNCTHGSCIHDIEEILEKKEDYVRARRRETNRRWDAAHREHNRARAKAWYEANRESHKAKVLARYWEKKNGQKAEQCG